MTTLLMPKTKSNSVTERELGCALNANIVPIWANKKLPRHIRTNLIKVTYTRSTLLPTKVFPQFGAFDLSPLKIFLRFYVEIGTIKN